MACPDLDDLPNFEKFPYCFTGVLKGGYQVDELGNVEVIDDIELLQLFGEKNWRGALIATNF